MEGEVVCFDELFELVEFIVCEQKVDCFVNLIDDELLLNEFVFFFIEYKVIQVMVVDVLYECFGYGCCVFINGDDWLDDVVFVNGKCGLCGWICDVVVQVFNGGDVWFLVLIEVVGEGIDLQDCCVMLIYVDMLWNLMWLYQCVGWFLCYGQMWLV